MSDDSTPIVSSVSSAVSYSPDVEKVEDYEAELSQSLTDTILKIAHKTFEDNHHAIRGVHAKSHALLSGELRIFDDLPLQLKQGIFAAGGTFPVIMRFSTTPGDILPDSVSTPRGVALKILGVEGERLPGSAGAKVQDFIMVNGPAFNARNGKMFASNLKLLAATTDKVEGVKVALSAALQGTEKALESVGTPNAAIKSLGGEPSNHPLGETYYTQVPVRYGDYIAKLSLAPVAPSLNALTGAKVETKDRPTAIREEMRTYFASNKATWELRVQLCTDLETMPIEDASKRWPEDQSPYIAIGELHVSSQDAWTEARSAAVDDGMAFGPWHGVVAHRPLGQIMRLRKQAYDASAAFRAEHGHTSKAEPDALPDAFVAQDDLSGLA